MLCVRAFGKFPRFVGLSIIWNDRLAVDTLLVHDHHSSPNILIQVQTLHVSVVSVFVDSFFLLFVWLQNILCLIVYFELRPYFIFLCPRHSKNGGGALSVTPVRASVRASVCVRPSVIKIWCPLNNFWKTALIQFKFSMLIYNIKTQVKFDLGYNPLIFDGVMGLL